MRGLWIMTVDYQLEQSDFVAFSEQRQRFASDSLSRLYYFGILPALESGWPSRHSHSQLPQRSPSSICLPAGSFSTGFSGHTSAPFTPKRIFLLTLADGGRRSLLRVRPSGLMQHRFSIAGNSSEKYSEIHICYFVLTPLQHVHIPVRAFTDEEHSQQVRQQSAVLIKTVSPNHRA